MVNKQEIDILVGAALEIAHADSDRMSYSWPGHFACLVWPKTVDRIGKMLWATNWSAVRKYYGEASTMYTDWTEDVKGYEYRESDLLAEMSIGGIIKQVHHYTFQASYAPGWYHSEAKAFCDDLIDHLVRCLTEYQDADYGVPEYDDILEKLELQRQTALEMPS
jgi:hypothetical protein